MDMYLLRFYYLFCPWFWRFSLFFSCLCHFWSFLLTKSVSFNISCKDGLVVTNSFKFCMSGKIWSLLFWMIVLLHRLFLTAYFCHSVLWIYHAISLWLAIFCSEIYSKSYKSSPCKFFCLAAFNTFFYH